MPNKRTGQDYQDYQRKKQTEAQKKQVAKRNKEMQEEYMRNIPNMAPKPKAKSPAKPKASAGKKPDAKPTPKPKAKAKNPKMGPADLADLRARIKKDKEKQRKNRKTLPHRI
jgi:hypothetical protein